MAGKKEREKGTAERQTAIQRAETENRFPR